MGADDDPSQWYPREFYRNRSKNDPPRAGYTPIKKRRSSRYDDDRAPERDLALPKPAVTERRGVGVKDAIKDMLCENPLYSVDEIVNELTPKLGPISRITAANIRAEWRHTIRNLQQNGVSALELKLRG